MQTKHTELQVWSSLNTVTKFDAGSTLIAGMSNDQLAVGKLRQPSSVTFSLMVESIVKQLCEFKTLDPRNQERLYHVICKKLYEMHLIDQSYSVKEYEVIRNFYKEKILQLITVARNVIDGSNNDSSLQLPRLPTSELFLSSRYSTDYEEIEYIARGGFGHVYRVRHNLDGMEYAVKKIYIQCQNVNIFLENLREVKMLARLHHPNIVAYKAAWLEIGTSRLEANNNRNCDTSCSNDDSSSIVFQRSSNDEDSNKGACGGVSDSIVLNDESISLAEESDFSDEKMVCSYVGRHVMAWDNSWTSAMLHVQMQLCEKTLRQWLDDRNMHLQNTVNFKQSTAIFQQIVQGVSYIHSQGIVHHDIKPSNIFVNSTLNQVQVGDFGLACYFQHSTSDVAFVKDKLQHKGEIGTKLYAAPEQIQGKCDSKSDLYSLGIVLYELMQPFKTDMERSKMVGQLRVENIPPELSITAPKWAQLISHLTKNSPDLRPSVDELQELLTSLTKETSGCEEDKDVTIMQLLDVISQRDHEIEELQKRLLDLETKVLSSSSKDIL